MMEPERCDVLSEVKGTKIIRVNPCEPDLGLIREAANTIRRGGTVAFPTETVYGLGADALNQEAVTKIFEAKQRPADNPIIVHIYSEEDVKRLSAEVPVQVAVLAEKFWPGPITIVLKAASMVPRVTTGGLDTVGIRMPSHRIARILLRESGVPIAAPSANVAGRPSPTKVEHVIEDLAGKIDMVIDGGPTNVGVESTVIDLTKSPPVILRPGGTTAEELRKVLGPLTLHPSVRAEGEVRINRALSPGMKYRHYAPKAEMFLVEGEADAIEWKIEEIANEYVSRGKRVGILSFDENRLAHIRATVKSLGSRDDPETAAKNVFSLLREFDKEGVQVIIAEGMSEKGLGLAVMNRLRKASSHRIIKV